METSHLISRWLQVQKHLLFLTYLRFRGYKNLAIKTGQSAKELQADQMAICRKSLSLIYWQCPWSQRRERIGKDKKWRGKSCQTAMETGSRDGNQWQIRWQGCKWQTLAQKKASCRKRHKRNSFYSLNQQRVTSSPTAREGRGERESKKSLRTRTTIQKSVNQGSSRGPGEKGLFIAIALLLSCWVMSDSLATPWTAAYQAPLSTAFPRQEC